MPLADAFVLSLYRAAGATFLAGALTGLLVAAAMQGDIPAEPSVVLASHLNALMGSAWLAAIAASGPHLRLTGAASKALVWLAVGSTWANWFVTAVKAFLHVSGVGATGDPVNDAVFATLAGTVVLPTLGAAVLWVRGLFAAR
jgi:hypothetical protein